jgi:hypothetical protein
VRDATVVGVSRADGSVIWAMQVGGPGSHQAVWRSADRGETWERVVEVGGGWRFQTPIDNMPVFCTDPADANAFWTLSGGRAGVEGSIARFDAARGRWTHCDVWQAVPRRDGNCVRAVVVDPRDPDVVTVVLAQCGQPRVLRSRDRGARWEDLTLDGHQMAGDALVISPVTGELIWGGTCGSQVLAPAGAAAFAAAAPAVPGLAGLLVWGGNVAAGP